MDHHDGTTSPPLERRHLGERPFVSLAEALTWIAFRDAMLPVHLRTQVEGHRPSIADSPEERLRKFFAGEEDQPAVPGIGHFHNRQSGLERLREAWRSLREEVERGTIKMRARFTPTYAISDASLAGVEELSGGLLASFSQFDVSTGGIRRQPHGSPDVLWQDDPHSFDREVEAFGDDARAAGGYLMVEVCRAKLLNAFPPSEASSDPAVTITSTAGAENICRDWLAKEFAADPGKCRSKADFRKAALATFPGRLSQRGFNLRVWPILAQQDGRDGAGAKKKS